MVVKKSPCYLHEELHERRQIDLIEPNDFFQFHVQRNFRIVVRRGVILVRETYTWFNYFFRRYFDRDW